MSTKDTNKTMLLHDASNYSSYSFKLETCLRSENMDEVVDVIISNPSNPDDNIVVTPMTDKKHRNAIANLTEEKCVELNPPSGNAAERKKQQKFITLITLIYQKKENCWKQSWEPEKLDKSYLFTEKISPIDDQMETDFCKIH